MVNVWMNDVVNACPSCLRWSMFACRQRCIFLRAGLARCACADEGMDIAWTWWSLSPDIVRRREMRDGLFMSMSYGHC